MKSLHCLNTVMNLLAALSSKGQPVWKKLWICWLCQVQRTVCLNEEMYMLAVPGPRASLAESSGEVEIIWFRIGLLNWNRPPEGITPAGPIITPSAARSKLCHRPVCISLQSIIVVEIVNKEQTCMPTLMDWSYVFWSRPASMSSSDPTLHINWENRINIYCLTTSLPQAVPKKSA